MVNQDIVKYLQEGQKRGFKISLLRQKLLEGGFKILDVDEAVKVVENTTMPAADKFSDFEPFAKKESGPIKSSFENKLAGGGKTSGGMKWMKFAGISGIILLALGILYGVFRMAIPTLFANALMIYIPFALFFVFILMYSCGFVKLGKGADEKKIKIGAWMTLVGIIIFAAISVLVATLYWNDLSSLLTNTTSDVSSSKTIGIVFGILMTLTIIVLFVGQIIFALGLIRINSQVKFSKAAGILKLIDIILINLLIIGSAFWAYSLDISFPSSTDILPSINAVGTYGILILVGWGVIGLLGVIGMIFEILVLFGASKKFE
ncbi:hypothetical protein J4402_04580 [Candidatus Pacearchaeota archaeon]|nr:hypothetical protein [Candidatus Pacearchaeota archaeon]